jgi:ATP-dependent DNA helicase RecG
MISRNNLRGLKDAIKSVHFPDTFEEAESARRRLAFNEIFFLQYYLHITKRYIRENTHRARVFNDSGHYDEFMENLPFSLTKDQSASIEKIRTDLLSPAPMNRLLQGDVGSGKTAVAAAISLVTIGCGYQVAYMVPTEVLAEQQFQAFAAMIPGEIAVGLLTGSSAKKERDSLIEGLASGSVKIVIGTHALIQDDVLFKKLGLVIIDEQHRFGVEQRAALREKGDNPDLLVMTATPIPRSLAMTVYGDMDVSFIRSKPSHRLPVKTLSFPESRINAVYNSIEKYISRGNQVYYVLPLIEESEKLDLKSAIDVFNKLSREVFPHRRVELLHGRLKSEEKEKIMSRFADNDIDILVSTTVIEVGIDIPNANVIIIEHSERFGLSQLHQLRGRVGRGESQSFCVLIYPDDLPEEGKKRIRIIEESDDGFRISEEDLKLRGAGQLMGTRQHGHAADFRFTDLLNDMEIIKTAREEAIDAVKSIVDLDKKFEELNSFKSDEFMKWIEEKRVLSILS